MGSVAANSTSDEKSDKYQLEMAQEAFTGVFHRATSSCLVFRVKIISARLSLFFCKVIASGVYEIRLTFWPKQYAIT